MFSSQASSLPLNEINERINKNHRSGRLTTLHYCSWLRSFGSRCGNSSIKTTVKL